jgi:hypothetical protein
VTFVSRLRRLPFVFVLPLAAAACGSKGPPLAPLRPVPAAVSNITAARLGDDLTLQFAIPTANADGTTPADVARVDVFALTGDAQGPGGRALTVRELETLATRIASIQVQPPPPPSDDDEDADAPAQPDPAVPPDPRPAQGAIVRVTETLTPALAADVFEHPDAARVAARLAEAMGEDADALAEDEDVPSTEGSGRPLLWMQPPDELARNYIVVAYSSRNRPGPISAVVRVPFIPAPPMPPAPRVTHTATAYQIAWDNPPGIRLPIQRTVTPEIAAAEELLPARPIVVMGTPHTYSVYELPSEDAPAAAATGPVNPAPLETPQFELPGVQFGRPRCFAVRTVERRGTLTLESELSPATCVTPVDTFPPAPPSGLTAVGSEGGVSLIWEASPDADVVGYLVLRGLPGEALRPLNTEPIAEATYRDTTAQPGIIYVYAVVAVDGATPPNVSPESNRVQEGAR